MSQIIESHAVPHDLLGKAEELINVLSREQLIWLGGYLSGFALNNNQALPVVTPQPGASECSTSLTILVGSHSGNSKNVARLIQEQYSVAGGQAAVHNMADYNVRRLKDESHLLVVVSTHGEGEPPAAAEDLHRLLDTKRAGDLSKLSFAVLALGDSSYKKFCQTGIDFHERLLKRGARALAAPLLLDVDYQDHLDECVPSLLRLFASATPDGALKNGHKTPALRPVNGLYQAEVLEKVNLNGKGSKKETYHIELSLEDAGFHYQPGDALEVFGNNDDRLVQAVLQQLELDPEERVLIKGESQSVFEALRRHRELTVVTLPVLQKLLAYADESDLNKMLDKREEPEQYLHGRDLLDIVKEFRFRLSAQDLTDVLRPLVPRAYSIASARSEVGDEVHLTVGALRYHTNGREHNGVCSTFMIDRLEVGDKVGVRLKSNEGFRLPGSDVPVIMIGPGTGIAPFRSFMQERKEQKAKGGNWLIFGGQHFETDFLYQAEWLAYRQKGLLQRIDVAFSRDQEQKVYVQNRLHENAEELYAWIENGACIYVCGDKDRMARDVRSAIVKILQEQGQMTEAEAGKQINAFRKSGRYQEDVY